MVWGVGTLRTLVIHSNLMLGTRRKNLQFLDTHTNSPLLKTKHSVRKIWWCRKTEQRTTIHVMGHSVIIRAWIIWLWMNENFIAIFVFSLSFSLTYSKQCRHLALGIQHSTLLNLKLLLRIIIYISYVSRSKNITNTHYKHLCSFIVECDVWRSIGMLNEHLDAHFEFWKLQQKWNKTNKSMGKKHSWIAPMKLFL